MVRGGGSGRQLIIASTYFPHGKEVRLVEAKKLVDYCSTNGFDPVVGYDANAHCRI